MRHNPQDQTSKEHNFKEIERLFVSYKIVKVSGCVDALT